MAVASLDLAPAPTRAEDRRFALVYGLIFVVLLLPTRFWAVCTLFQNRWGTRNLPSASPGQLARVRSRWALR
jgi:hypothetical protein